jgi:hypothetical protein
VNVSGSPTTNNACGWVLIASNAGTMSADNLISTAIESECLSGFYDFSQLKSGISNGDITQHAKSSQIGDHLAKEFYPLANKIEVKG